MANTISARREQYNALVLARPASLVPNPFPIRGETLEALALMLHVRIPTKMVTDALRTRSNSR
jgi:hypothetical protein